MLKDHGWDYLAEVSVSNSRRVDIMALNKKGEILVVEIKSGLPDFAADNKWHEYLEYCDYFYFAVDGEFPLDKLPNDTGIIVADQFGGAILKESDFTKLNASRRKALTLKFARIAARRLNRNLESNLA
jgi:hypothetical protein